jgi:electron transfer flavoprotein alpha/beta subunit
MAAKKKEIRTVALPASAQPSQQVVGLAVPSRHKQTQMLSGAPGDVAKDLVRRLREEARAL